MQNRFCIDGFQQNWYNKRIAECKEIRTESAKEDHKLCKKLACTETCKHRLRMSNSNNHGSDWIMKVFKLGGED